MSTVFEEAVLEDRPEVDLSLLASLRAEPASPIVFALDIGTSGIRAALFDGRGNQIEELIYTPLAGIHSELGGGLDADADELVRLVASAVNLALERFPFAVARVDYVAVSCFWHSLMGVDDEGNAVTPVLGWADRRAANEAADLCAKFDERETHARTGCRFHPSYWPAKLVWLKQERRELFDQTRQWMSFPDYCSLKLFGKAITSVSMASGTGLLNQNTCEWDRPLIEALGLDVEQLPRIAGPGETIRFHPEISGQNWPALEGAAWFPAIGDGAANNVGAGCIGIERTALMVGTSGAMRVALRSTSPASLPPELFCYRLDRDRIVIGGALSDGGGLYQWMRHTLAGLYSDGEIELALAATQPDSHGLTILPFWFGERSTGWSSSAQGAIVGLTATTKPIDILRAGMEAVACRFALLAASLEKMAPRMSIVGTGNALLSSPAWAQMIADALGRRIELSVTHEASCRGAALLALEAVGKIDSLETIDSEFGQAFEPDMKCHAVYARAIERQQKLYEKLVGHGVTETQR
jgi:gluconokinase